MYKSSGTSYCFGLAKSALAGFSLTSLVLSSWRCCLLLKQTLSDWLLLAIQLLWSDFLPHCPGLPCQKLTIKCWRPPRFHWFSPNFSSPYCISAHRCPIKNGKSKKQSPSVSNINFSTLDLHPETAMVQILPACHSSPGNIWPGCWSGSPFCPVFSLVLYYRIFFWYEIV